MSELDTRKANRKCASDAIRWLRPLFRKWKTKEHTKMWLKGVRETHNVREIRPRGVAREIQESMKRLEEMSAIHAYMLTFWLGDGADLSHQKEALREDIRKTVELYLELV